MKKDYIGLWLLLVIGFILTLTVAFSDEIKIGSYTLKKAAFRESLLTDKEAEARELARQDSILAARRDSVENSKDEAEVDSLPQSILVIGDSMTFNIALRIAQYAKANGHTIHTINWDSSGTVRWGESRRLENAVKEHDATFVFICLGSNELYRPDPKKHQKHIDSILTQIGDIPYVWVGPPNWKGESPFNDYMEAYLRPGAYFRSEGLKLERKKDGIHPTREGSVIWVDSIARWMPKSSHPIKFDTPPDTIGTVDTNLTYLKSRDK